VDAGVTQIAGNVVTADTDSTRLLTGTSDACGTSCAVADGPFVLTDVRSFENSFVTWLVLVDTTSDCSGLCRSGSLVPNGAPVAAVSASGVTRSQAISGVAISDHLSGARILVPAGKRLCACGSFISGTLSTWKASWSGFVPYQ
jgi:hypothetical protein